MQSLGRNLVSYIHLKETVYKPRGVLCRSTGASPERILGSGVNEECASGWAGMGGQSWL